MLSNEKWFGAEAGFYPETIDQSLRFEDGDSPYLLRTPSSTGNRKTSTISCWFKIGNTGLTSNIISVFQSASPNQQVVIRFYQDKLYLYDFGGAYLISTNRVFRDTTNWYHMVWRFDSTQSTASERIKLYINGTLQTDLNHTNYPSLNHDSLWNHTNKHLIGARTDNSTPTPIQEFDGYLAEFNLVDGQSLGAESFGETKNDVWIPKKYTGSYGTNGFRLTFADSSSLGDDTSGNGNDFTSSGLASTDVVLDSPTNNFCTTNPLQKGAYITLSEGNLKVAGNNATNSAVALGTFAQTSGKWYFEVRQGTVSSEFIGVMVKQVSFENSLIDGSAVAQTHGKGVVIRYNGNVRGISGELQSVSAFSYTAGDIIGIAFDMDNGAVYFAKNNTWLNSGDPTSGSSKTGSFLNFTVDDTRIATPALDSYTGGFVTGNFGQDSSFAGTETAQGNADANGQGDFYYTPPSGFLALCSSNLPDTTISPAKSTQATDHFNTVLWTGTGTGADAKSVGFQTDWLWVKDRQNANHHILIDSSRGVTKYLQSSLTSAEATDSNIVQSFDTDGFTTVGQGINFLNVNYVGWNWKANGGTTSSNTDGSITSTVQTSTDAGFSIVTYTGTGSAGTIGHGLGKTPAVLITKNRSDGTENSNWVWWHGARTNGFASDANYLYLNTTSAGGTSSGGIFYNGTQINTTTYGLLSGTVNVNKSGDNYLCLAFAEIEGYSKMGTYIGNGSTDGTYVHLGFRPAWVLIKQTNSTGSWVIHDNKRSPFNVIDEDLFANLSYHLLL